MNRIASSIAVASIALVALAGLARPAAAKPDPFQVYVADLVTNPKAAAAHLASCELALLPNGEVRRPGTLALADLVGAQPGVTLEASHIKYLDIPMSTINYMEATVAAKAGGKTIATFRVLEVGGMGNPDADFAPSAVHWAKLISDKDATAAAKAKTLPAAPAIKDAAPPPGKDDDQDAADRDEGIREMTQWISSDDLKAGLAAITDGGVVYGSAPGQRYSGKAAGKQIKGWKLALARHGGTSSAGGGMIVYAATDIVGTTKDKTPTSITYAALVVASVHMIEGSGDRVWETKIVSFAVPQ